MNKQLILFLLFLVIPFFSFSQHIFTNSTSSVGINAGSQNYGHASAWCDIDNDGDLDLSFTYDNGGTFKLYRNDDGIFTDITSSSGLSSIIATTIMWAEVNGDEYSDMITASYLYINNGDNTFTNSGDINQANANNSLCDFNADGNIDILTFSPAISILFGNGNGTFGNVYDFSLNDISSSACFDYDADGDMDIIFGTNGASTNKLFQNNGDGTFTDATASSGITANTNDISGIATGDINNDGFPDLYFAIHIDQNSDPQNILFKNNGDGTFTNITTSAGVVGQASSRTAVFFDYNNDGFLDILVDDHYKGNHLYSNNQDETFTEVAEQMNITDAHPDYGIGGDYFGTSVGDFNNDGASDIFVTGHWSIYKLYENTNCPNNYISIKLIGVESDYNAVGSQIKITCGNFTVYRWIKPAESMNDFYALTQNIGIGDNTFIDEIEIVWSSGNTQTIQNINANQIIEIIEGEDPVKIDNLQNQIFQIYPNPCINNFDIKIPEFAQNSSLKINLYRVTGELVKSIEKNNIQENILSLNIDYLQRGVYILKIYINKKESFNQKIIFK